MKSSMLVLLSTLLASSVWAAEGCTINAVHGTPKIERAEETLDPQNGDLLKKGDFIVTPTPQCQIDMSMNDLAGCRVLAGSRVEVVAWKKENMNMRIVNGNIILNLKKLPDDAVFRVETPTAVATVRGTQFWGRVQNFAPTPVTTFAVREGAVEIQPVGSPSIFKIEAGKALDIPADGTPPAIRSALTEELAAMEQAIQIPMEAASA